LSILEGGAAIVGAAADAVGAAGVWAKAADVATPSTSTTMKAKKSRLTVEVLLS
jgi:hypothetical protein